MVDIDNYNNEVFNNEEFIEEIIEEIEDEELQDDFTDHLHDKIDNLVDTFDNNECVNVINVFAGGIYEAIKLYEDHFGDYKLPDNKHKFYKQLAFISMSFIYIEIIIERLEQEDQEEEEEEEKEDKKILNNKN